MEFDWYIPAAVVAAFTLLTTLKLTLTRRVTVGAEKKTVFFFHPLWLGALVVEDSVAKVTSIISRRSRGRTVSTGTMSS